ncbi:MAG: hypothetical protein NTY47_01665 [Candidatus Omnitrophica bacterium]|nr:hypothetical protein [Candidatus Omnitrophota bacterium]
MNKGSLLGRLSLFAFGCASTQGVFQPQSQSLSQPLSRMPSACAYVMSRQEMALLGFLILLIASLIVVAFENTNKKFGKKAKKSSRKPS